MSFIKIPHPDLHELTRTTADMAAAATTVEVENNSNLILNDYIVLGGLREEKAEIILITSVSGDTTVNFTGASNFDHPARTQLAEIKFNQIEVSRASSEGGSYSVLDTIAITPDEDLTLYDDSTGSTTDWYKARYKNSTTGTYSAYSEEVQATGYTDDSLFSMAEEILDEMGDEFAAEINRNRVYRALRGAVRDLTIKIIRMYPDYRKNYTTQALTSGTERYDLPTRFLSFVRVDINYSGSAASDAYKVYNFRSEADLSPEVTYSQQDPYLYIRALQYGFKPTPNSSSGYAFLWYWDYPATMTDETDEHGLPHGARDLLVTRALYKLWIPKDKDTSVAYRISYRDDLTDYLEFVGQSMQAFDNRQVKVNFGSDLYDN